MMATFSAYALSAFFLMLFFASVAMIFTGDVPKGGKAAVCHIAVTVVYGAAAYVTAWLGGI